MPRSRLPATRKAPVDGTGGWDEYAPYYDWENARTLGRSDLPFWRNTTAETGGRILELGCGTGRLLVPLARAGASITGIDLSAPMLARARARVRRLPRASRPSITRGDIRALPFPAQTFDLVMAPYGMLQSLVRDRDLDAALAEAARVLRPGGRIGIDLVPDLVQWNEYAREVRLRGPAARGARLTLVESVRQDRRKGLTIFDEEFIERRAGKTTRRQFSLVFRTLSLAATKSRLAKAGFTIEAIYGDYDRSPWTAGAETSLVIGRRSR